MRLERQDPSGLNVARNRGAVAASGEILAYLDDDVLVPPGWARAVLDGFERFGADALAGRIRLRLGAAPPRWLSPRLRRYLSELELGDEPRWLADEEDPYGANCAVTRTTFERIGGFGAALDREGASLRSNGDVEFFRRLRAGGGRVVWWPAADSGAPRAGRRLTPEWFRRARWVREQRRAPALTSCERRRALADSVVRPTASGAPDRSSPATSHLVAARSVRACGSRTVAVASRRSATARASPRSGTLRSGYRACIDLVGLGCSPLPRELRRIVVTRLPGRNRLGPRERTGQPPGKRGGIARRDDQAAVQPGDRLGETHRQAVAITGVPQASASSVTRPKPSRATLGTTATSAAR